MSKVITYSNKVNGWTSFHSFNPQLLIGMNNKLYSFSNGDLWQHHDDDAPRNTFYGVHYNSKISFVMNQGPSDVKFLKAVSQESNDPWDTEIVAYEQGNDNLMLGVISKDEYIKKEGIYHAYARRKETSLSFDNKSSYGLGIINRVINNDIVITGENYTLAINDKIYTEDFTYLGEALNVRFLNNETYITLNITPETYIINQFTVGVKNARTEGSMLRGYAFKYNLENEGHKRVELYAVNSEVEKSYI